MLGYEYSFLLNNRHVKLIAAILSHVRLGGGKGSPGNLAYEILSAIDEAGFDENEMIQIGEDIGFTINDGCVTIEVKDLRL